MFPHVSLPAAPHTMLALLQFLERTQSPLTPAEIADEAILGWLEQRRDESERLARPVLRGYQWKCLFLPEGTRLRVWCRSEHGYAEVVGDNLMYKGRSVSPNQFVAACSDTVRNAWVEISVLMPGETAWKLASVRRREIQAAAMRERTTQAAPASQPTLPSQPAPSSSPALASHAATSGAGSNGPTASSPAPAAHGVPARHAPSMEQMEQDEYAYQPPHGYEETRRTHGERRDPRAPLDRRESY